MVRTAVAHTTAVLNALAVVALLSADRWDAIARTGA